MRQQARNRDLKGFSNNSDNYGMSHYTSDPIFPRDAYATVFANYPVILYPFKGWKEIKKERRSLQPLKTSKTSYCMVLEVSFKLLRTLGPST